jgi:putative secretion ATPase (PEP-CTERM system associated)
MYEKFYGLIEKPFGVTPDPRFLFLSPQHREALAYLQYGVRERTGFVAIIGEVGTGKTTLLHALLNDLDASTRTAFVFNTALTAKGLFRMMAADFGIKSSARTKTDLLMETHRFLLDRFAEGVQCVLVIDEAQNLNYQLLEEVRMLSNLETDREKLLQIIMVGQPELATKLAMPRLRQLRQRINARYHLAPLGDQECAQYIMHRLRVAGLSRENPFSPETVSEIYRCTEGIPRLINMVCDRALVLGYARERRRIDLDLIGETIAGLSAQGALPSRTTETSAPPQPQPAPARIGRRSWPRRTLRSFLAAAGIMAAALLFSLPLNTGESTGMDRHPDGMSLGMEGTSLWWSGMVREHHGVELPPSGVLTGDLRNEASGEPGEDRSRTTHALHVASFRDLPRAETCRRTLEQTGFQQVFILPVELDESGRWHRVLVGRYDDHRSALEAAGEYLAAGTLQFAQPLPLEVNLEDGAAAGYGAVERTFGEGVRDE